MLVKRSSTDSALFWNRANHAVAFQKMPSRPASVRYRPSRSGTFLQQLGLPLSLVLTAIIESDISIWFHKSLPVQRCRKQGFRSARFCRSFWWNEGGVCWNVLNEPPVELRHVLSAFHLDADCQAHPVPHCGEPLLEFSAVDESLAENFWEQALALAAVAQSFFGKAEDHWRSGRFADSTSADVHLRQIRVKYCK